VTLVDPSKQPVASGLLFPFQNGQVVRVEEHRHQRSPLELTLANKPAKASDLGKILVASKNSNDLTVPALGLLPGEGGLEVREFFFDAFQSRFELSCGLSHVGIVRQPALGSKANKGTASNFEPAFRASVRLFPRPSEWPDRRLPAAPPPPHMVFRMIQKSRD
jgi:hypothetical protein